MPRLSDKFAKLRGKRAGRGVKDVLGNDVPSDSTTVGALHFNGESAVKHLGPTLREHLELPAQGSVTLTADQFDHLVFDAAGSGWHNAVRQFGRWVAEATGGSIQIGETAPLDDDTIGEPQGNA